MTELPALLRRQLTQALSSDGSLALDLLIRQVAVAYDEADRDRRRVDRSQALMAHEMEQLVERLEVQNLRFEAALDNMSQGLCMFDAEGGLVVWNRRFLTLYGLPAAAAEPGIAMAALLRHSSGLAGHCEALAMDYARMCGAGTGGALVHRLPDGRSIMIRHERLPGGGHVDTFEEITERLRSEAEIRHLAQHDALTGLPNRLLLQSRLAEAVPRCQAQGGALAVLCLDLDHFKTVNDTLGHAAGDRLLCEAVARMRAVMRAGDLLARLGGDEFVALIAASEGAGAVTALSDRLIATMAQPVLLDGQEVRVGLSIGIAFCGEAGDVLAEGAAADAGELLRRADMALYQAKADGRNTWRVFRPALSARLQARRLLEAELRRALAEDALELHYQPQIERGTGRIIGAEALLRWRHPQRGPISPAEFVPMAEEAGLMVPLGEWVLRRGCRDAVAWGPVARAVPVTLSINVSPLQLRQRDFPGRLQRILDETGFDPRQLELEITETAMLHDAEATFATLRRLKRRGIRIALDDFGTGYSSLSHLRHFAFDKIKVDRSFVRDMACNAQAAAILRAIIGLGRSLGMRVNAEGVETPEQARLVQEEGCDEMQGFLYSAAIPAAAFAARLREQAAAESPAPLVAAAAAGETVLDAVLGSLRDAVSGVSQEAGPEIGLNAALGG